VLAFGAMTTARDSSDAPVLDAAARAFAERFGAAPALASLVATGHDPERVLSELRRQALAAVPAPRRRLLGGRRGGLACDAVPGVLAARGDGTLRRPDERALALHLGGCPGCRAIAGRLAAAEQAWAAALSPAAIATAPQSDASGWQPLDDASPAVPPHTPTEASPWRPSDVAARDVRVSTATVPSAWIPAGAMAATSVADAPAATTATALGAAPDWLPGDSARTAVPAPDRKRHLRLSAGRGARMRRVSVAFLLVLLTGGLAFAAIREQASTNQDADNQIRATESVAAPVEVDDSEAKRADAASAARRQQRENRRLRAAAQRRARGFRRRSRARVAATRVAAAPRATIRRRVAVVRAPVARAPQQSAPAATRPSVPNPAPTSAPTQSTPTPPAPRPPAAPPSSKPGRQPPGI